MLEEIKSPAMVRRVSVEPNRKGREKLLKKNRQGFPGGTVVGNPPANAGDTGRALVREDPTCRGATKPASHNH